MTASSLAQGASGSQSSGHLEAWAKVLGNYANQGGVDYAALQENRVDLDRTLASLGGFEEEGHSPEARDLGDSRVHFAVVCASASRRSGTWNTTGA